MKIHLGDRKGLCMVQFPLCWRSIPESVTELQMIGLYLFVSMEGLILWVVGNYI